MSLNQTVPSPLPDHNEYLLNVHMLHFREDHLQNFLLVHLVFLLFFPCLPLSPSLTPAIFLSLFLFSFPSLPYSSFSVLLPPLLMSLLTPSISHWCAHIGFYCIHVPVCSIFANLVLCSSLLSPFPCGVCCPSVWQHGL